jgi:hypothetical protein
MTTKEFAALLQAKRSNEGWSAKCPAHNDRSPSLSIREGDGGRVLLRCFAGCSIDSILAAMNLHTRDLFAGPPPSPEQLEALRAAQTAREQAARMERQSRLAAIRDEERLRGIVNELGGRLARHLDDNALAERFHRTCSRAHAAEMIVDSFYLPLRGKSAKDRATS